MGALAALGVLLGATVFLVVAGNTHEEPRPVDTTFSSSEPTAVDLVAGEHAIVFVHTPPALSGAHPCEVSALTEGSARIIPLDGNVEVRFDGVWRGLYQLTADRTGRYELVCGRPADRGDPRTYGIGPDPDSSGLLDTVPGMVGATVLGIAAAALLGLIVLLSRGPAR